MIYVDYLDRGESTATFPTVCMHCEEPTCALVCPADAIKKNELLLKNDKSGEKFSKLLKENYTWSITVNKIIGLIKGL